MRLERPSTTLGDSATRPCSRSGKRPSKENPWESPCDWLPQPWRVDPNSRIVHTTYKNKVNPTKRADALGDSYNQHSNHKSNDKITRAFLHSSKICSHTRRITCLSCANAEWKNTIFRTLRGGGATVLAVMDKGNPRIRRVRREFTRHRHMKWLLHLEVAVRWFG